MQINTLINQEKKQFNGLDMLEKRLLKSEQKIHEQKISKIMTLLDEISPNDNLQERTRTLPDKPPQPKRPPQPQLELDDSKPPPMNNFDFDVPDFSLPTDFSGAFLGSLDGLTSGTSQLIPIVKVAPRCPREASMSGTNGSVLMLLNVNASGKLDKVIIKQAKPARMFNTEASRAVRRWQFKPKTVDGVAVDQMGELLVEFECNV